MERPKVAIVYPYIPHYRSPVFDELIQESSKFNFVIFYGTNTIDTSIQTRAPTHPLNYRPTRILTLFGLTYQLDLLSICLNDEFRYIIFLGDPHFILTWIYAAVARFRGKNVLFWTHGWLRKETGLKKYCRNIFYKFANGLLLYGVRARMIGIEQGFEPDRLTVIFNSLDYSAQRKIRKSIASDLILTHEIYSKYGLRYFACISRLTRLCRFDLAIIAISKMRFDRDDRPSLVLIGEGPEKQRLEDLAMSLGVSVFFVGAIYEENIIGPILYNARAVVSPGKVGLTAMHSLAYGTPVITHGTLDSQMPEVEAIIAGMTGDFFAEGDTDSLSQVLQKWIERPRQEFEREACINVIEACYTPQAQRLAIESALH